LKGVRLKNGSSQGQNLALTGLCVPFSLGRGRAGLEPRIYPIPSSAPPVATDRLFPSWHAGGAVKILQRWSGKDPGLTRSPQRDGETGVEGEGGGREKVTDEERERGRERTRAPAAASALAGLVLAPGVGQAPHKWTDPDLESARRLEPELPSKSSALF